MEKLRGQVAWMTRVLKDFFGEKIGFILIVTPFGSDSRESIVTSNARDEDVPVLLREQAAALQGKTTDTLGHG